MKITAGAASLEGFLTLADAGADEVFLGYVPYSWLREYGNDWPLNRREALYQSIQISSLREMDAVAQASRRTGCGAAVTFNSPAYTARQVDEIGKMAESLIGIGIDRFIVADLGLALRLRNLPCRLHLSGESGEFNHLAMEEYRAIGFSRYIFHRKVPIADMAVCAAVDPGREYEAFLLNEMCHFTGAFCTGIHSDEMPPACREPYALRGPCAREIECDGGGGCGLCALPLLRDAGITHLKIVGRGASCRKIAEDVRLARDCLLLLSEGGSGEEFRRKTRARAGKSCGGSCYYAGE